MAHLTKNPAAKERQVAAGSPGGQCVETRLLIVMCRWICVYPAYIDGGKTASEGRRIAKSAAVAAPTLQEMANAVKALGVQAVLEVRRRVARGVCHPPRVDRRLGHSISITFSLAHTHVDTHSLIPLLSYSMTHSLVHSHASDIDLLICFGPE
jgi:signal recognition particle subunit SEC65